MIKRIFPTLVAIWLLSGCAVEPEALALIPTPVPEPPYQPCEPEQEVVYTVHSDSGGGILVLCGDLSVDDRWLRAWAKDAMDRDGASRMMKVWEEGARTDGATAFYMSFFLEADRSCLENRGELARLIETYAEEFRDREHIDFPLLAATNLLHSDVMVTGQYNMTANQDESPVEKIDCGGKFAALSAIPDPPPLCFAGDEDAELLCFNETFNEATGSNSAITFNRCNTDEAMIAPGQTVAGEASDALAAHIDITQITTALSGETLTVVFHLRDVPESLTFNRTGIKEGLVEYMWEVSIDRDNDWETGVGGFEYTLSALYFPRPGDSGDNTVLPIGDKAPADVWAVSADGSTQTIRSASIGVSADADTITLVGEIPGITPESRLVFKAYDFLDGSDEVACHLLSSGD